MNGDPHLIPQRLAKLSGRWRCTTGKATTQEQLLALTDLLVAAPLPRNPEVEILIEKLALVLVVLRASEGNIVGIKKPVEGKMGGFDSPHPALDDFRVRGHDNRYLYPLSRTSPGARQEGTLADGTGILEPPEADFAMVFVVETSLSPEGQSLKGWRTASRANARPCDLGQDQEMIAGGQRTAMVPEILRC